MHLVVVALVLLIIVCLGYILYLKIFKKHTRERFAFFGLSTILALVTTLCIQVYSSQGVVTALFSTSNFYLDANFSSYKTDYKDHIICFGIVAFLCNWIFRIHQNWGGPVSAIHAEKKRFKEENNIYMESLLQLKDFFNVDKKIIPYSESAQSAKYQVFNSSEVEKAPWYEDVYELFVFGSNHYIINIQTDYFKEERCIIGKYGINHEPIAILCSVDEPDEFRIKKYLDFIHTQNRSYYKIFIAIKNVDREKSEIDINGFLVTFRYYNELLNNLVDFSYYKEFIRSQFESKEITVSNKITLEDFYVSLDGNFQGEEKQIFNVEEYVLSWLTQNNENKHLAILGEYGCGKSVLSLKITYELLHNNLHGTRIPILIELRGKSPRNLSTLEILSTWASTYRIEPFALLKLHRAGRLVIIFEGFDEMDMVGDKEVRFSHFQRIWEFAIPNSKLIITGRPNFFLDNHELKINLGIEKPFETSHFCEAIYLEKLKHEQIQIALRKVDKETSKQVVELIGNQKNSNFYDLVSRPAILYLVSVIWKVRKLSEVKTNINSAKVIGEFIQYSYSRQTDKNVQFPLTEHEREYFMLGIAAGMLKHTGLSNQINKIDLENIILKLYRNFPEDLSPIKNATQQNRENLFERLKDNNSAEEMILTDVRSCGILVNDLSRKDYFKFAHKSFFEYLVSLFFGESLIRDRDGYFLFVKSIANALDLNLSQFGHSKETITFTAEILANHIKINREESEISKRKMCEILFGLIYPLKVFSGHPKIASRLEIIASKDNKSSLLAYSVLSSMILVSASHIYVPFISSTLVSTGKLGFKPLFTALFMIPAMSYILLRFLSRSTGRQRAKIWFNCCRQLNISDEIMTQVTSDDYLLYINGRYQDLTTKILRTILPVVFNDRKNN